MRRTSLLFLFTLLLILLMPLTWAAASPAQQATSTPNVVLSAPSPGQALQGVVEILGNSRVARFKSYSLAFAYQGDETNAWFLIIESVQPVENGLLAQWDTTTITDGNYDLRLTVTLKDDSQWMSTIEGLRVRNYTPIETDTPAPPTATEPVVVHTTPTVTPTSTPVPPTVTPLPTNPAELSREVMVSTLGRGGLAALGLLILLGLYLTIQNIRHPRKPPHP